MIALAAATATEGGFWASSSAVLVVAGVCALLAGACVTLILRRKNRPPSLRERVGEFVSPPSAAAEDEPASEPITSKLFSRTERSLERERWWADFQQKVEIARIDRSPVEIIYITAICTVVLAVLLYVLAGALLGLLALVAGPLLARAFVNLSLRRQRNLFADQLPSHLQELAAAMRAGHSMISGLTVMAEGAAEPTRGEFRRVLADEQLGTPLQDALRSVAVRMQATDVEQVSLVAELNQQTGGNMAEVLDRVAEAVRERAELNREVRTLTAQARMSRAIVSALPPFLLGAIELVNPTYLEPLFETSTGHVLLVVATALVTAGWLVMGRIVRIEV
jgi:tight adherence protein B